MRALTRVLVGVGSGVLVLAVPGWSMAQGGGAGPCEAEIAKFCKDVKPGGGRIQACLKQHEAELSKGCQVELAQMKAVVKSGGVGAMGKWRQTCAADRTKFCKDVKPGEGRVAACLKEHKAELSADCKAALFPERAEPEAKETGKDAGKQPKKD